jgi:putative methionine-R-sulfoxide reductase with GAF domain
MKTQLSLGHDTAKRKTLLWKVWFCYTAAFLFTGLILATLIGAASSLMPDSLKDKVTSWTMLEYSGLIFLILFFTRFIGNIWRGQKEDLKLGFTDLPNPFFDEHFIQAPHYLKGQIRKLQDELEASCSERDRATKVVQALNRHAMQKEDVIEGLTKKLTILIRHDENARRLLNSAAYLAYMGESNFRNEMLNNILSECLTCLEKDHSDKSVALFKVNDDELRIEHYIRLAARSARDVRFKKGEGFAGMIWDKGEVQYIPDISNAGSFFGSLKPSEDYNSIVGIPIRVNSDVLGVLCVQSEIIDGFSAQDLRTLRFYA